MNEEHDDKQTIEQLSERHRALHTSKIQAETNLNNTKQQLDELKKQAHKEYGTDNIGELKAKLTQMEKENEKKRRDYQRALDQIEVDLAEVEKKYGKTEEADEEA